MSATLHMCLSVRGALRWPDAQLRYLCADENGDHLKPDDVREWLMEQLAEGREVLPMGEPCEGFDYKTGCPGHRKDVSNAS